MTRTLADIPLNTLSLEPSADVGMAMIAMQKAKTTAAAIMRGDEFMGFITVEAAVLSEPSQPVIELMRGAAAHLPITEPVRIAARSFVNQQADFVAVFDGEKFVGLLSSLMLITELGRSYDPLTGLSWSDRLREWGAERLEIGQEIGVVFFDLNDFGLYNKRYGHVTGDRVIQAFARLLENLIEDDKDVLVRYGGDEFAIGTTRSKAETEAMLGPIKSGEFSFDQINAPVTFSYGISGGKRSHEPSREHVAATLDNLIELASRACLAAKNRAAGRTRQLVTNDPGTVEEAIEFPDFLEIAARAASAASAKARTKLNITETYFSIEDDGRIVVITGYRDHNGNRTPFRSSAPLSSDVERSIIDAVNASLFVS